MADYEKVKAQIHNLIANANEVMESNKTNLTDCIGGLISGFGQGEDLSGLVELIGDGEVIEGSGNIGGSGSGSTCGSTSLNIHFGETAPEDTSMLWCKCEEPSSVQARAKVDGIESVRLCDSYLPNDTEEAGAVVIGNKVYVFGSENEIKVFDTETETITTLSVTLPEFCQISVEAIGNKIYLFGGYTGGLPTPANTKKTIYVFDVETETISTLSTTLPTALYGMTSAIVGNKIYLFGGRNGATTYNTICVFDVETETVTKLATKLPKDAYGIGSAIVGNKIYLFGGLNTPSSATFLKTICIFDVETETISTLSTTLPTGNYMMGTGLIGNKIYLFGGSSNADTYNTIHVFDSETETISTLSITLPKAQGGIATGVVGNRVYLFGGSYEKTTIVVFSIDFELATNILLLQTTLNDNVFDIIDGIEIGVKNVYIGNAEGQGELVPSYLYKDGEWTQI